MLPWMEVSVRVKPEADRNFADTFMQEKSDQVEIGNLYLQNIIPLSNIREDALRDGKGEMKTRLSILVFLLVEYLSGDCRYFLVPYPSAAGGNGTSDGIRGYPGAVEDDGVGRRTRVADTCVYSGRCHLSEYCFCQSDRFEPDG